MATFIPLVRTPAQILNNLLSDFQATMFQFGYTNVNADPGSDTYIIFKSVADQIAIVDQSVLLQANADMPDTATGDDLTRLATIWGLQRKSASSAVGYITLSSTNPTTVVAGSTLSVNSLSYQVVVGGVYSNGDQIFIQAVSSGEGTNQPLGTVLTWASGQPLFATNTATCSTALIGGTDDENDASLRNRLLSQFANPPSMGNWQDVVNLATSFDPLVQNAFVYGDANGPGTTHVAVVGYQTISDVTRVVPTLSLNATTAGLVANLPVGLIPGLLVTTITPVATQLAFQLSLPLPNGTNSQGWVNSAPWPNIDTTNLGASPPHVVAIADATHMTISATSVVNGGITPLNNITSVAWVDTSDDTGNGWRVIDSLITTAIDNGNNTWTIVLQTPFNSSRPVQINDYIFPSSVNEQTYLNLVLGDYAVQGPGQKTQNGSLLPFSLRQPLANNNGATVIYLDTIGVSFLRSLENQTEVGTAVFFLNSTSGAEPPLPTNISGNPSMWIPGQVGFYKL